MNISRRDLLQLTAAGGLAALARVPSPAMAQPPSPVSAAAIEPNDRVFITNEDSNTIGGIVPPHAAMTARPLYHGAINVHGLVPSLDSRWLATTARGSSNVYVIDTLARKVLGGGVNPQAVGRRRRRGSHRDRRPNPFVPVFLAQIPLGELALPSGRPRNKKSIDLVYVRPGARSQSG